MASSTTTAASKAAEASEGGLPQLDFSTFGNQIFWLLVTLIAIYLILSKLALPRIAAVLAERQGTISHDVAMAEELKEKAEVLSLHTPQTVLTEKMVNTAFIEGFEKNFWLINTARGKSVVTKELVLALKSGKILGAGLDVLEYEKSSFENLFSNDQMPVDFKYLIQAENVLLSPHVGGWTKESKEKLAQTIVSKVKATFAS